MAFYRKQLMEFIYKLVCWVAFADVRAVCYGCSLQFRLTLLLARALPLFPCVILTE